MEFRPSSRERIFVLMVLVATALPLIAGTTTLDLGGLVPGPDPVIRVLGPNNDNGGSFRLGVLGVPVAGGFDADGDGFIDYAIAHFRASPFGRNQAGTVSLVFGDGTIGGTLDLAATNPSILKIHGAAAQGEREMAGSEIWLDDVTGDGLGDLLICRQNFSLAGRPGVGALTILVGNAGLHALALSSTAIDLASPPPGVTLLTIIGGQDFGRFGIWIRTGDVTNDGLADIVVGADQEGPPGTFEGAVYVIRGGTHLSANATIDLAGFGTTSLAGNIARIEPPNGSTNFHLGGTCQVGDLDGDGRAEVIAAATINRAGASVGPYSSSLGGGGAPDGRLYIVWGDVFPLGVWPAGFVVDLQTQPSGDVTTISGGVQNSSFGEELLAGLDYSGDGNAELFVGDLVGDGTGGSRPVSGIGYVFYHAALLRGLNFNIDSLPPGIQMTKVLGPNSGAIGSDTVAHGDFNNDGIDDLMIGNPGANPLGRSKAGSLSVFLGQNTPWPALVDTAPGAATPGVSIFEIQGAHGNMPSDTGDTLGYSASVGDLDGDSRTDIIANEMRGNGAGPNSIDSGNLIVVSGAYITGGPAVDFIRGDANQDGVHDLSDPIVELSYLFGGAASVCLDAFDANDDGDVDLADPIYQLNYQFGGGTPPSPPFPTCGPDPTSDGNGCASFAVCP